MKKYIFIFLSIILSSCATVFNEPAAIVRFSSVPDSAEVFINGKSKGFTPLNISLDKSDEYEIELKKEKYKTEVFFLTHHIGSTWFWLDFVFGFAVYHAIDAGTGAWYEFDKNELENSLIKE